MKAKVTYRRVVPTFWNDRDVRDVLDLGQKAVLLYTFTNEHAHPCGVYRLTPAWIEDELGIRFDAFLELVHGPLEPFVTYDDHHEEIFVHAMAEHQIEGGLHGHDRRIPWVEKQVASIRADHLRAAFADRYSNWNLGRDRMDVPAVENSPETPSQNGPGSPFPLGSTTRKRKGHKEGASGRGLAKGHTPRGIAKPAAATAVRTSTSTPSSPTPPSPPEGREDDRSTTGVNRNGDHPPDPVAEWEPVARANLRLIRGRDDDEDVSVTPKGGQPYRVGMGLEITRYRRIAAQLPEGAEIVARAIRFIPQVTGLQPPITLARWLEAEDGAGVLEQCLHRALEETPRELQLPAGVVKTMPPTYDADFEQKRAAAKALLELARDTER